ncbi:uncharacterized protein LOC141690543 [Apium graveolens]|uniref:uncharacterized protein LOC141690543 n=1 Tax=Apium graveolens TaxID=4045 RepID=UPI003D78FF91
MTEFNGRGDPEDHCDKYELLMTNMGHSQTMLCKIFKTYLKGEASIWYKSLQPRSIHSYEQLKGKFIRHYSHLCRIEKDTETLIHCRQRENESLGDYLAKFKEEAGMMTNLNKNKAMGYLTTTLDPTKGKKLLSSLYDYSLKSLNDIYVRGENIRRKMEILEGYREPRREDRNRKFGRSDYYRGSNSDRRDDRRNEGEKQTDKGLDMRRDRDSTAFTPFNTPISKILHEIKGKSGFVRPTKMKMVDHKKNADKYCDYHQDKGHNVRTKHALIFTQHYPLLPTAADVTVKDRPHPTELSMRLCSPELYHPHMSDQLDGHPTSDHKSNRAPSDKAYHRTSPAYSTMSNYQSGH